MDTHSVAERVAQRTKDCLSLIKDGGTMVDIIILIGRPGAGKSSLLEDITGTTGHSQDVTSKIQIEEALINGHKYFIMDTPGFDAKDEQETFYKITDTIQEVRPYARSWGLLYVSNITESRFHRTEEKLVNFITQFSGTDNPSKVVFVTTHWEWHSDQEKANKMGLLNGRGGVWNTLLSHGAQIYHHGRDLQNSIFWYTDRATMAQRARDMVRQYYENKEPWIPLFVHHLDLGFATHLTAAGSLFGLLPQTPPPKAEAPKPNFFVSGFYWIRDNILPTSVGVSFEGPMVNLESRHLNVNPLGLVSVVSPAPCVPPAPQMRHPQRQGNAFRYSISSKPGSKLWDRP
ncbi:hypothetical protein P154DRAFT_600764 [Amniculicola lignicola CBS 123094]|uniref:G domain-containing protein n=1 Tax=Amniculicola lignicola CBS 123094 TaxID=1392246 RepID=A0A6A5WY73_9PLEO|nr:hypothetical protein P154DRAFT_600764 [Amniculicola lignicola CBS 123094]